MITLEFTAYGTDKDDLDENAWYVAANFFNGDACSLKKMSPVRVNYITEEALVSRDYTPQIISYEADYVFVEVDL